VLGPAERQQLGQEVRRLAERCEGRIPGRDIGQLGRHRILAEIERGDALRPARAPAGADEQALHPYRHLAEQGAERRPVVALARQLAPARLAHTRALAQGGHLHRYHLGLQRRRQPLRLLQPQPELGHADLRLALDAREFRLGDDAGMLLRHQHHPPLQLRQRPTLVP
jgi:hypothetical protein